MSPLERRLGWAGLALGTLAGLALLDHYVLRPPRRRPPLRVLCRYAQRSGLPRPAREMRGAARDFAVPRDFRIPEALRPWGA